MQIINLFDTTTQPTEHNNPIPIMYSSHTEDVRFQHWSLPLPDERWILSHWPNHCNLFQILVHLHKQYKFVHVSSLSKPKMRQITPCIISVIKNWKFQKGNKRGVSIHWTGLLDWNTGLDYWTGILLVFTHSKVLFLVLHIFNWVLMLKVCTKLTACY